VIWAVLVLLGVPLWLCATAILALVFRNRNLRRREGDLSVRVRSAPDKRWRRGHALWVHDVFSFRGSPAAWNEALDWVTSTSAHDASASESKRLHRLGDDPVIVALHLAGGRTVEVAARAEDRVRLLGPLG
jgi:hypothetical protein